MEEEQKKENSEEAPEEKEPSSESPKYQEIDPEELNRILEEHQKWVESKGRESEDGSIVVAGSIKHPF